MFLTVTKQNLLSLVSEYEIYSYYIPNEDLTRLIISPLRPKEKNPSFSLFRGVSGELCFNDFTLKKRGDVIKFVTEYYNSKGIVLNFQQTLWQIVKDLNLENNFIEKYETNIQKNNNVFKKQEIIPDIKEFQRNKKISIKIRDWKKHDILFWQHFGIPLDILKMYNVVPILTFYVEGEMFVADKHAYCYLEKYNNKLYYKIYQPFNKKFKWISSFTTEIISGYNQLPKTGDFLIITKSLKDVMSIKATSNIDAISFQNEGILPNIEIFENLKKRFKDIVILYDNDFDKEENYGIKFAKKLSEHTNIPYTYFDEKYGIKDYSEGYELYGDNIVEILKEILWVEKETATKIK